MGSLVGLASITGQMAAISKVCSKTVLETAKACGSEAQETAINTKAST